jgi:hypothetical protein
VVNYPRLAGGFDDVCGRPFPVTYSDRNLRPQNVSQDAPDEQTGKVRKTNRKHG